MREHPGHIVVLIVGGALCATAIGCAEQAVRDEPNRILEKDFRAGLLMFDAYMSRYEDVGRRLAHDPEGVSQQERQRFVKLGEALKKMSRGLNIAVGNYEAPADGPGKESEFPVTGRNTTSIVSGGQ